MTISVPIADGSEARKPVTEDDPLRVASWPNAVTGLRIVMVPALVGAFFIDGLTGLWLGFAVFAAAALSDFFDGWLARRLDQHSLLGRILDPIADKLLVAAALVMLASDDRAPVIAVVAILGREFLISGLREALAGTVALPVPAPRQVEDCRPDERHRPAAARPRYRIVAAWSRRGRTRHRRRGAAMACGGADLGQRNRLCSGRRAWPSRCTVV